MQYGFGMAEGGLDYAAHRCRYHQSEIFFTTNNQGPQDAYTILNARLQWIHRMISGT